MTENVVVSEKVEEYKKKLEAYEKKQLETAKTFDIDEALQGNKILYAFVPELDCQVRYKRLTMKDLADINKAKTDEERATLMLYKMLSKADKNVTLEKVQELPIETATAILNAITRPLVQTVRRSKGGLNPTV